MWVLEPAVGLVRGYDVMAACDLPKVDAWVRFPLPAPKRAYWWSSRQPATPRFTVSLSRWRGFTGEELPQPETIQRIGLQLDGVKIADNVCHAPNQRVRLTNPCNAR